MKKKKPDKIKIPKSVQDVIPYEMAYPNGVIETQKGLFSMTYTLGDTDFMTTSEERQDQIFKAFGKLINTFGSDMRIQFTINNKQVNKKDFEKMILVPMRGDENDKWRKEHNQVLKDKLKEGRSNMHHEKYMTVCLSAENIDDATQRFSKLKGQLMKVLKQITKVPSEPLSFAKRMSLMSDMLNRKQGDVFYERAEINGIDVESVNYYDMKKQGLTSKDLIAPMSMEFKKKHFILDSDGGSDTPNKYARVLRVTHFATKMTSDMLAEVTDLPIDMVTNVGLIPMDIEEGIRRVKKQYGKVKKDVYEAQKSFSKEGVDPTILLPEDTKEAFDDAEDMMEQVTENDQKLFLVSIYICVYADDLDSLNKDCKTVIGVAKRYLCDFKAASNQQMVSFRDVLPVCSFSSPKNILRTTEQASVFLPYSTENFSEKDGIYYGLHALSRNMIILNRKTSKTNSNGVFLGMPGSGKSFSAKREMYSAILCTDDIVYIIDPQGEYSNMVKAFGGEALDVGPSSDVYMNPLDMDLNFDDGKDPVKAKMDSVLSFCEIAVDNVYGLDVEQVNVIKKSTRLLYEDYIKRMNENRKKGDTRTINKEIMPTLGELYDILYTQGDEGRYIAKALENHMDTPTFANRTNIDIKNRVVSFNLADMGESEWEFGLNVCLNTMWNQLIENHRRGKRTWIYFDEFHLLTRYASSARTTGKLWKMARKWGGIPTGITQNVEDLLGSPDSRRIIGTSAFVLMLEQSPQDALALQELFHISDTQLEYLTSGDNGVGLIWNGKSIIPFEDKYPTDTKLYKLMSTKPEDFQANFN